MDVKLSLSNTEHKELTTYCNLNDLLISSVVKKSFTTGFNVERYGLLGESTKEVEVIKEVKVIEYVDREVIKEIIVEVPVPKIVNIRDDSQIDELVGKTEQLKKENELFSTKLEELNGQLEIFSTKTSKMENIFQNEKNELLLKIKQLEEREPEVVEKLVGDETKQRMLEQTLQTLRTENFNKDKKIKELEEIVSDCKKYEQKTGAVYLRGTNLDETLYK
jgi:Fe2+ transport system protein B